jgi:perosamine synthetase
MIRVSEPLLQGNEKKYLAEAIDAGEVSSGGSFVRRFEEAFAKWSGNDYAVAVSSGTAALEVAARSLTMTTITIPAGTIISCFIAATRAGVAVSLHDNITWKKDGAVMRCHLFGCFDRSHGKFILDDLSQYWKPIRVKDAGCYSLYANKLITSGEGGVVVTNNKDVYERAKSYRDLCHSKERFVHYELGYNFRMSNLQAAVALAQLEQIEKFIEIKRRNRDLYIKYLPASVEALFMVDVPWMYLVQTKRPAGEIVSLLKADGIECRRFFYPLHRQPCIDFPGEYPIADELWNYAFYMPSGLTLTEAEIINVCEALRKIL